VTAIALVACACATSGPKINFVPSAAGASLTARPAPCDVEVHREKGPDRPFTTLGVINFHREWHRGLSNAPTVDSALPPIKERACAVGADAVVLHVTEERRLEFGMLHVAATAVRFDGR
jgi:hypothetical protein